VSVTTALSLPAIAQTPKREPNAPVKAPATGSANGPGLYLTPAEIAEIKSGTGCKSTVRQIVALKKKMAAAGLNTDFYELSILPQDQLIKGQVGSYYAVYLKDAQRKERFQFGGGDYTIEDFDTRFRGALSQFARELLAPLHGGVEYKLYVRGSASSRRMKGKRKIEEQFPFASVTYLPSAGADLYDANASQSVNFSERYGNDDLPYLRAAFLQKIVTDMYPLSPPTVLQSTVSESRSKSEQYAELLLYIEWQR
jgi:hypothetical protein